MPFKKGQSGNLKGRPKMPNDLAGRMRKLDKLSEARLSKLIESGDEAVALKAIELQQNRGHGKVPDKIISANTNQDVENLQPSEIKEMLNSMMDTLGEPGVKSENVTPVETPVENVTPIKIVK
jgi:hypothetical protein